MTATPYLLAIDQGTTSTRAVLFDGSGTAQASASQELPQIFPQDGWVEHDPTEIWNAARTVSAEVIKNNGGAGAVTAIGITNQRETTILWDRQTGEPLHNAIVWQDRRTADRCAELRNRGHEAAVQAKTGLLIDPYFSATKLAWLLDNVSGARAAAERGALCFGTVDSWLLWNLTDGAVHATDATNAARTMLFNIADNDWDADLLALFDIPRHILPEVHDSSADFGSTAKEVFGTAIPICGIAGDQHAATVGQACTAPGMVKSTYGTGCFALVNTGDKQVPSTNRMLSTLSYRLDGKTAYALEGSIFMAGAIVQWLRDGLGIIRSATETTELAAKANPGLGVYVVPAFTGLGAPYWDADARGAVLGLTRDAGPPEIVRAALESVSYQSRDLIEAMGADMKAAGLAPPKTLRVDGGMVANDWFAQNLADHLGIAVERPENTETTALGAAFLAGLGAGVYGSLDDLAATWRLERAFEPRMGADERDARYAGWKTAVGRVLTA